MTDNPKVMTRDEVIRYIYETVKKYLPSNPTDTTVSGPSTDAGPIKWKCPDFPYCKVCTPFEIRLSTPGDMKHFLRYHG